MRLPATPRGSRGLQFFRFQMPQDDEPTIILAHDGPVFVIPPHDAHLGDIYRVGASRDGLASVFVRCGVHEVEVPIGHVRAFRASRTLLNRVWTKLGGKPRLTWAPI